MAAKYGKSEAKAVAREKLRGLIPGPVLPIDADGEMDETAYRHNIRHCLDVVGSEALYINSYYQNYWLLSSAQRRRVLEVAMDEIAGAVPVINRCAHHSPKEAIELAQHAQDLDVDFISLVLPPFGANKDILFGYFQMIARELELGITIFNTSQAGYSISPEWMAELAEIPNICALKNGLDLEHTGRIRELVGDSIVVVDPNEENFLENIRNGQQAIFSGTQLMFDSARAQPLRAYMEAAFAGDLDKAQTMFDDLQPVRDLHHRWVLGPWRSDARVCPVGTVKFWCEQLGMIGGPVPEPLPDLSEAQKKELRSELVAVGLVEA
ncbi:dihydrodipicolinate synthase family protein [Jiangella ureilytica]|uniref:Dihydrodipicolinate synthase family protein n=1 Tax=Jiangella ureilytica TaxID=2530374 RepID=A0A4V2XXE2_9ACTN|nr:dihydrodipicolinate synthase family protein [Jiangella ureilytica]TDC52795.1 dihydrodipicolinate synthase family protein [Jiangella ureilytica]